MKKTIRQRQANLVLQQQMQCHPVLARVFASRGIQDLEELDHDLAHLLSFESLKSIPAAVARLFLALQNQEKVVVIGDFDADGATSTAIAVRGLRMLGFQQVEYLVPNRFEFGYGLSPEIVEFSTRLSPQLLITVDNGIVSFEGALKAQQLGMDLIITDHHLGTEQLPVAAAVVNPNQIGDPFPSKNLAGCGVMFYVLLALRAHLRDQGYFEQQAKPVPNLAKLLDIVALGTVADLVTLDHNNRILVHHGLKRIRELQACPGILALLKMTKRDPRKITATDLGFAVAPRLNAAGRMEDMSVGIECLLTDDVRVADQYARQLNQLNEERREVEAQMRTQAFQVMERLQLNAKELPKGICLFHTDWHQGIVGLIASRVKDQVHRPTIIFARGDAGEIKGSARSIPGVHLRDVLADISAAHPGLLIRFGGHAMAAGLTIAEKRFEEFRSVFQNHIEQLLKGTDLTCEVWTDGSLEVEEFTLALAETIRNSGPFGQHFPEPLFDDVFTIVEQRLLGGQHLKLLVAKEDLLLDAIHFFVNSDEWPNHRAQKVHMAYRLSINEYQGRQTVQLLVDYMEPLE